MAPSRGTNRTADGAVKSSQALIQKLSGHRSGGHRTSPKEVGFNCPAAETRQPGRTGNLKQRATQLLSARQQLPIWSHAKDIKENLRSHEVLLLVGETGSGKSTQIPQFLVNEKWCRLKSLPDGSKIGGCIAITQPRRVAAISLARRVADEMGTPLGNASPASEVGYSVRFDNSTSPSTRIKFLTEGMLLQEMLRDPWLKEYSAVVVDEVHERGVNVDLVLAFLRKLQQGSDKGDGRGGNKIKVAVMSATADMDKIRGFFDIKKLKTNEQEDEWEGFSKGEDEGEGEGKGVLAASRNSNDASKHSRVASLFIKGRQYPVETHYAAQPVPDIIDAALQRIIDIHTRQPLPGDVLVFLTGQETVESLLTLVEQYAASLRKDQRLAASLPKLLILPLYAALPSNLQQRVFQSTPKFTRKIILATNIAETSITVPGIHHVIDCGKSKRRMFRPSLNLDSLLTAPISRSSANQRSGRAGRDAPGHAYRLYTEADFYKLAQDTEPEILRCDLSQLVITLKSDGIDSLKDFPLLTKPPKRALERAIVHLLQLQAIDPKTGQITPLGKEMSLLPLPGHLARILMASSESRYDCVDEVIDIVSALSVENVFLNIHTSPSSQIRPTFENDDDDNPQDPRLKLRQQFYRREGDHLTLLATVQAYVDENTDRKRWCEERAISHRAMQAVMDVRKQLTTLMKKRLKNITNGGKQSVQEGNDYSSVRILRCLLTGLHPQRGSTIGRNFECNGEWLFEGPARPIHHALHKSSYLNPSFIGTIWEEGRGRCELGIRLHNQGIRPLRQCDSTGLDC